MKILITSENRVRHDSTGEYFKRAFKELLGEHNVLCMYNEELKDAPKGLDLYLKIDDGLDTHTFPEELHPSAYYIIDSHLDVDWRRKLADKANMDNLFFAQKKGMLLDWHTKNKAWVPLAAEKESHYVGVKPKKYDTCFIGYFHSKYARERVEYVHELFKTVPNFYFSQGSRFFKDMAGKFAESKIVFNKSLNQDINMRFFEGSCSGSALMSDYIEEAKELGFRADVDYIAYDTIQDMKDKAEWYLKHDTVRERLAYSGMQFVHDNHLYKHRAEQILSHCLANVRN